MKLLELFQSDIDYEVGVDTESKFRARATIGGRPIIVVAQKKANGLWDLDFVEEREDGHWTVSATGSGASAKVFSFVVQVIKLLYKKHEDMKGVYFIATGKSRCDLYDALIKRYTPAGFKPVIMRHDPENATYKIVRA